MDNWFSWFDVAYRIAVVAFPIALALAALWLRANFAPLKEFRTHQGGFSELNTRISNLELQIEHLTEAEKGPPTRLYLAEALSGLTERIGRMEAASEAERRSTQQQLATLNNYLHTLVEIAVGGRDK